MATSMDMLAIENHPAPGLMAITLKTVDNQHIYNSDHGSVDGVRPWTFEIRVVHGSDEIHSLIKKSVESFQNKATLKETFNNGTWSVRLKSILESEQDYLVKVSCYIFEALISHGWEVSTSGRTTVTPGFEFVTWILKVGTSVTLSKAEVTAVVINQTEGNFRIVPNNIQINNIVRRAMDSIMNPKDTRETVSLDESKSCDSDSLRKFGSRSDSPLFGGKRIGRAIVPDDPECPGIFPLEMLKKNNVPGAEERITVSNIVLEIVHFLFCRQWKMVSHARLPMKQDREKNSVTECDILFFCRDSRILPSIGQQTFSMVELEGPNYVRFFNIGDNVVANLKNILQSENYWPEGLISKDSTRRASNCQEFKCQGSPWTTKPRSQRAEPRAEDKLVDRKTVFSNQLVAQLMLAMNKNEFNVFGTIQLGPFGTERNNYLIFKHSVVSYNESLCLHLEGQNRIALIGGGDAEVTSLRHILQSRWPYPITFDKMVQSNKGSQGFQVWMFKVKRYPWAVSYGNKFVDCTVDWTRSLIGRQVHISTPQNSDPESGKSVLVHIIKDLMRLGWRVQMSADISSTNVHRNFPPKMSDPFSIFLMR